MNHAWKGQRFLLRREEKDGSQERRMTTVSMPTVVINATGVMQIRHTLRFY